MTIPGRRLRLVQDGGRHQRDSEVERRHRPIKRGDPGDAPGQEHAPRLRLAEERPGRIDHDEAGDHEEHVHARREGQPGERLESLSRARGQRHGIVLGMEKRHGQRREASQELDVKQL